MKQIPINKDLYVNGRANTKKIIYIYIYMYIQVYIYIHKIKRLLKVLECYSRKCLLNTKERSKGEIEQKKA